MGNWEFAAGICFGCGIEVLVEMVAGIILGIVEHCMGDFNWDPARRSEKMAFTDIPMFCGLASNDFRRPASHFSGPT